QGYLWFCTTGGLSLFDGLHFSTYGKEDGLPSDGVFDFAEGPNGRRWVATNRGLAEFRPSDTPRFLAHLLPGPAPSSVRKLLVDHDGRLWVGTSEGLFREAGRGFETVELPAPEMYAGREIRGLRMDRFGALWIAARSGLYRRWLNGRVERYTVNDGLLSDNVESLLEDRTGMLWAGTRSGLCWLSNTAVHAKIEGCIS